MLLAISAVADDSFFEAKIRPLLVEHCGECHSAKHGVVESEFNMDSRFTLLGGGDRGVAVIEGNPENSLLIKAIKYDIPDLEMPPDNKLSDGDVQILEQWIKDGARMPEGEIVVNDEEGIDFAEGRKHWAFQPLSDSRPGKTDSELIDYWIRRRQRRNGVKSQQQADPEVLVRRLALSLTGIPPSFEEVEKFRSDPTAEVYEDLLDDYLDDPKYGERWARHWLDLVRYTDTTASWLKSTAGAWRYRDWVIKALNQDVPYDVFVKRQFAADVMADSDAEDMSALGMLGLSPTYWKEPRLAPVVLETVIAEEWEERIDMVGRTFLGLSLACARCHDHKFDPVSQKDYYALAGVFANARILDVPIVSKETRSAIVAAVAEIGDLNRLIQREQLSRSTAKDKTVHDQRIEHANQRIAELKKVTEADVPKVPGIVDASIGVIAESADMSKVVFDEDRMVDVALQHRGNPANKGEVIARRYLSVFDSQGNHFRNGSGRQELATAMFNHSQQLVARVMVNRVWGHHFGQHLVDTPSDFGLQGSDPTHPELLDALALRLIVNNWSLKWLHRIILQSETFQQGSEFDERSALRDPDNLNYWRANRRRLDIEAWRDGMLSVSGLLNPVIGGEPQELSAENNYRRTIYAMVKRRELHDVLKMHGFPEPTGHSPKRVDVDTPLQQLYALNSEFIWKCATHLASGHNFDRGDVTAIEPLIQEIYKQVFMRLPTEVELRIAVDYLSTVEDPFERLPRYIHALLISNEFAFVE